MFLYVTERVVSEQAGIRLITMCFFYVYGMIAYEWSSYCRDVLISHCSDGMTVRTSCVVACAKNSISKRNKRTSTSISECQFANVIIRRKKLTACVLCLHSVASSKYRSDSFALNYTLSRILHVKRAFGGLNKTQ